MVIFRNRFGTRITKGGKQMHARKIALLVLLGCLFAPVAQAQIKHIEMRVEGMT